MGVTGLAVGIGFLLIAIVVVIAVLPDAFSGLFDGAGEFYTATKLKPKIGIDELVCDLRINVNAKMIQDVNIGLPLIDSPPKIEIKQNDSHNYNWFNCKFASQYNTFDLLNAGDNGLQQNVIILTTGETIITHIAIVDAVDSTQRVDRVLQPQLERKIVFPSLSSINTPYDVSQEYVISDIPVRDFKLLIHYDAGILLGINDLPRGTPYTGLICDENKALVNGQCVFVT